MTDASYSDAIKSSMENLKIDACSPPPAVTVDAAAAKARMDYINAILLDGDDNAYKQLLDDRHIDFDFAAGGGFARRSGGGLESEEDDLDEDFAALERAENATLAIDEDEKAMWSAGSHQPAANRSHDANSTASCASSSFAPPNFSTPSDRRNSAPIILSDPPANLFDFEMNFGGKNQSSSFGTPKTEAKNLSCEPFDVSKVLDFTNTTASTTASDYGMVEVVDTTHTVSMDEDRSRLYAAKLTHHEYGANGAERAKFASNANERTFATVVAAEFGLMPEDTVDGENTVASGLAAVENVMRQANASPLSDFVAASSNAATNAAEAANATASVTAVAKTTVTAPTSSASSAADGDFGGESITLLDEVDEFELDYEEEFEPGPPEMSRGVPRDVEDMEEEEEVEVLDYTKKFTRRASHTPTDLRFSNSPENAPSSTTAAAAPRQPTLNAPAPVMARFSMFGESVPAPAPLSARDASNATHLPTSVGVVDTNGRRHVTVPNGSGDDEIIFLDAFAPVIERSSPEIVELDDEGNDAPRDGAFIPVRVHASGGPIYEKRRQTERELLLAQHGIPRVVGTSRHPTVRAPPRASDVRRRGVNNVPLTTRWDAPTHPAAVATNAHAIFVNGDFLVNHPNTASTSRTGASDATTRTFHNISSARSKMPCPEPVRKERAAPIPTIVGGNASNAVFGAQIPVTRIVTAAANAAASSSSSALFVSKGYAGFGASNNANGNNNWRSSRAKGKPQPPRRSSSAAPPPRAQRSRSGAPITSRHYDFHRSSGSNHSRTFSRERSKGKEMDTGDDVHAPIYHSTSAQRRRRSRSVFNGPRNGPYEGTRSREYASGVRSRDNSRASRRQASRSQSVGRFKEFKDEDIPHRNENERAVVLYDPSPRQSRSRARSCAPSSNENREDFHRSQDRSGNAPYSHHGRTWTRSRVDLHRSHGGASYRGARHHAAAADRPSNAQRTLALLNDRKRKLEDAARAMQLANASQQQQATYLSNEMAYHSNGAPPAHRARHHADISAHGGAYAPPFQLQPYDAQPTTIHAPQTQSLMTFVPRHPPLTVQAMNVPPPQLPPMPHARDNDETYERDESPTRHHRSHRGHSRVKKRDHSHRRSQSRHRSRSHHRRRRSPSTSSCSTCSSRSSSGARRGRSASSSSAYSSYSSGASATAPADVAAKMAAAVSTLSSLTGLSPSFVRRQVEGRTARRHHHMRKEQRSHRSRHRSRSHHHRRVGGDEHAHRSQRSSKRHDSNASDAPADAEKIIISKRQLEMLFAHALQTSKAAAAAAGSKGGVASTSGATLSTPPPPPPLLHQPPPPSVLLSAPHQPVRFTNDGYPVTPAATSSFHDDSSSSYGYNSGGRTNSVSPDTALPPYATPLYANFNATMMANGESLPAYLMDANRKRQNYEAEQMAKKFRQYASNNYH